MDQPTLIVCALGVVFRGRVADLWCDPAVCVEAVGGTLTKERDDYGPWPDGRPVAHYTIRPIDGAEVLIQATGAVHVDVFGTIVPLFLPETQPLPADWPPRTITIDRGGVWDANGDGEVTDADIEAFFACLAGSCCPSCTADWDRDGDTGTDADVEAFMESTRM